jgi:hypothetical protein
MKTFHEQNAEYLALYEGIKLSLKAYSGPKPTSDHIHIFAKIVWDLGYRLPLITILEEVKP